MTAVAVRTQPPLRAILRAFDAGAHTLGDVSRTTGLDPDVVRAGVDHLVRLGRVRAKEMTAGCPSGGCAGCALADVDGPCHGTAVPAGNRSRSALVQLSLAPAA